MDLTNTHEILTHNRPSRYGTATSEDKKRLSNMRATFFNQDTMAIQQILRADLLMYMDGFDIDRMKMITLDYFVTEFLAKICNVYDSPPIFKVDDSVLNDEKFTALMDEIDLIPKLDEAFQRMRLHNTAITHIKYNKNLDRVFMETSFHAGNVYVKSYDGFETEWEAIAYEVGSDNKEKKRYIVWDRGVAIPEYYQLVIDKSERLKCDESKGTARFNGSIRPIGSNEDIIAPNYNDNYSAPFVVHRYKEQDGTFWGNGMDSLIELIRSINTLLTVANDDTIQETIRLLILNFTPTGTASEHGSLKTGLRHPLFVESDFGDSNPSGQILSADLNNTEIMALIDKMVDIFSSLHKTDNLLGSNIQTMSSGIHLRIKNEPMLRQWANDINLARKSDKEVIEKVVMVNNYHRDSKVDESILEDLLVEYQEPKIITDDKEEYELEKIKWEDGTSSPLLYVMRRNPEMTEEDAKEYLAKNLDDFNAVREPQDKLRVQTLAIEGDNSNKEGESTIGKNEEQETAIAE